MHWFDELLPRVESFLGEKKDTVISAGLSVSGLQHVGRLRGEVVLANAIAEGLRKSGRNVKQILVLYTQDSWKGKDGQLAQFGDGGGKEYVGRRLIDVPDPKGCHENWVDHYWRDFGDVLEEFATKVEITSTTEVYQTDEMRRNVLELLEKAEKIREIVNRYRGRMKYPEGWIPFEPLCKKCMKIGSAEALSVSEDGQVSYKCSCGDEGASSIEEGKLNWRLEWPSLWKVLSVDIEPFGKDHATPGGSRDSCKNLAKNVMSLTPPFGIAYEWVGMSREGTDLGDMSSSDFKGFTPKEWLEFGEPHALRFIYLQAKPSKRIVLDLAKMDTYHDHLDSGYSNYWQDEKEEESELKSRTYDISAVDRVARKDMFILPYKEASLLTQISSVEDKLHWVVSRLTDTGILTRELAEDEEQYLSKRIGLADAWITKYAPESYHVELQEELPEDVRSELTEEDVKSLAIFRERLEGADWNEDALKETMIQMTKMEDFPVSTKRFFRNLYLALLGKEQGPRAAPFLSILEKDFVLERLDDVSQE
ncbi:MAG: lysine--tRNA ligase [Methanomassiliicoccales archaeon]|nr:MAG: lysine--tRNA ligase [Methanomassiliicoccales archaeon]